MSELFRNNANKCLYTKWFIMQKTFFIRLLVILICFISSIHNLKRKDSNSNTKQHFIKESEDQMESPISYLFNFNEEDPKQNSLWFQSDKRHDKASKRQRFRKETVSYTEENPAVVRETQHYDITTDHISRFINMQSSTESFLKFRPFRNPSSFIKTFYMPVLVVADKSFIDYHKYHDYEEYLLTILNNAADYLNDFSLGLQVQMSIAKIKYIETKKNSFAVDNNKTATAADVLQKFCTWADVYKAPDKDHSEWHDVAILITRENLLDWDGLTPVVGAAYYKSACTPHKNCVVVQDAGLILGVTIAHHLGYLLGAGHDDGKSKACPPRSRDKANNTIHHLMAPFFTNTRVAWSSCSRNAVASFFRDKGGDCLKDKHPKPDYEYPGMLPGAMYEADVQCQLIRPASKSCKVDIMDPCKSLYCSHTDGTCKMTHYPPAQGTPCGINKWCFNAECVHIGYRPLAVNGRWGEWEDWGPCSRTCGGGVQLSYRECNLPPPLFGGYKCMGSSRRERICNVKDCETSAPSFRANQCAEFNKLLIAGKHHNWHPIKNNNDDDSCALYCKNDKGDQLKLRERVQDGTPCSEGTNDLCIEGKCVNVGCDWVIDSNTVPDICGICGGDGTSCQHIFNTFTCNTTAFGHVLVGTIPAKSRKITILQACPELTKVSIATKYFGMYPITMNSEGIYGEFLIGNIVGKRYGSSDLKNGAMITIEGPLPWDIDIYAEGCFKEAPIRYSYKAFKKEKLPSYARHKFAIFPYTQFKKYMYPESSYYGWQYLTWSRCTVRCEGGTQTSRPVCVSVWHGLVDDHFCSKMTQPSEKVRTCNQQPCAISWRSIDWKDCGPKTQLNQYLLREKCYCMKEPRYHHGNYEHVDPELCDNNLKDLQSIENTGLLNYGVQSNINMIAKFSRKPPKKDDKHIKLNKKLIKQKLLKPHNLKNKKLYPIIKVNVVTNNTESRGSYKHNPFYYKSTQNINHFMGFTPDKNKSDFDINTYNEQTDISFIDDNMDITTPSVTYKSTMFFPLNTDMYKYLTHNQTLETSDNNEDSSSENNFSTADITENIYQSDMTTELTDTNGPFIQETQKKGVFKFLDWFGYKVYNDSDLTYTLRSENFGTYFNPTFNFMNKRKINKYKLKRHITTTPPMNHPKRNLNKGKAMRNNKYNLYKIADIQNSLYLIEPDMASSDFGYFVFSLDECSQAYIHSLENTTNIKFAVENKAFYVIENKIYDSEKAKYRVAKVIVDLFKHYNKSQYRTPGRRKKRDVNTNNFFIDDRNRFEKLANKYKIDNIGKYIEDLQNNYKSSEKYEDILMMTSVLDNFDRFSNLSTTSAYNGTFLRKQLFEQSRLLGLQSGFNSNTGSNASHENKNLYVTKHQYLQTRPLQHTVPANHLVITKIEIAPNMTSKKYDFTENITPTKFLKGITYVQNTKSKEVNNSNSITCYKHFGHPYEYTSKIFDNTRTNPYKNPVVNKINFSTTKTTTIIRPCISKTYNVNIPSIIKLESSEENNNNFTNKTNLNPNNELHASMTNKMNGKAKQIATLPYFEIKTKNTNNDTGTISRDHFTKKCHNIETKYKDNFTEKCHHKKVYLYNILADNVPEHLLAAKNTKKDHKTFLEKLKHLFSRKKKKKKHKKNQKEILYYNIKKDTESYVVEPKFEVDRNALLIAHVSGDVFETIQNIIESGTKIMFANNVLVRFNNKIINKKHAHIKNYSKTFNFEKNRDANDKHDEFKNNIDENMRNKWNNSQHQYLHKIKNLKVGRKKRKKKATTKIVSTWFTVPNGDFDIVNLILVKENKNISSGQAHVRPRATA